MSIERSPVSTELQENQKREASVCLDSVLFEMILRFNILELVAAAEDSCFIVQ